MILNYIIPPVIGAVIGYITNDIAIKMLFHPRKTYYIGRLHIPFTPGLIPKEKKRIAASLGKAVGEQLLNEETISNTLISEEMISKLRSGVEELIDSRRNDTQTVGELIEKVSPKEVADKLFCELKESVTTHIYTKLTEAHLGEQIADITIKKAKSKLNSSILYKLTGFIDDAMIKTISKTLGEHIDKIIEENSESFIKEFTEKELDKFRNTMICDVIKKYEDKLPDFTELVISAYKKLVCRSLASVLKGINLSGIVEERISGFDVVQFESLIFGLMKRELNAIVYLGALLGFLLGFINIFI